MAASGIQVTFSPPPVVSNTYSNNLTICVSGKEHLPSTVPAKRKKKRKILKKRQSLINTTSTEHSQSSNDFLPTKSKMIDRLSDDTCHQVAKLPGIVQPSTGTGIYMLSSPPPRQTAAVGPLAHERRKKVPLLAAIKPENERMERDRFMRANLNYNPLFLYRSPADPDILARFTTPSNRYLPQAILIMERAIARYGSYEKFEEETGGKILTRPQILNVIKRFLKKEDLECEICLNLSEDLISRGSMTRCKGKAMLNVRTVNLREQWAEGLLRHEIGTHYLRSHNNRYQPWSNYKTRREMGLKPFNPTEEGLASLHSVLLRDDPCMWRAALLYYTAYMASQMSFKELFRDLGQFVHDPVVRWDYCLRAKRGQTDTSLPGGFCKDQVYLDGALQLLRHRHSLNFCLLVRLGKIDYSDIDLLEEQADLHNTRLPHFMHNMTHYRHHIDRIALSNGLTDDILADVS